MSKPGTIEMTIELNGVAGYQPNSADVVILKTVHAGIDTILWNGRDGNGNPISPNQLIVAAVSFYSGITNFPLYNPGLNDQGIIVTRIRPTSGLAKIYWDDSDLPGGTYNVSGQNGPTHTWSNSFGNSRTINTWWNSYRIDSMRVFQFHTKTDFMPIELFSFSANTVDSRYVELQWVTASEANNDYFTVERSKDATSFEAIGYVNGSGNSNTIKDYSYIDNNPYAESYYRLKQTDYDGTSTYSKIIAIQLDSQSPANIRITNAGDILYMSSNVQKSGIMYINIYDLIGKLVDVKSFNVSKGQNSIAIQTELKTGSIYLVSAGIEDQTQFIGKIYIN